MASAIDGPRPETRDKQRRRGRVEIDADGIHRVFDDGIERARQLLLVDIVLILADADRLRLDLDEFGERILQAAGDGDGAAQRHVEVAGIRQRRSSEAE